MTDDADALLRAVLAAPDDDAPRLVYADWLEEHGDMDRAAFIRAQIELARLPVDHEKRTQLVRAERTLWNRHRIEWTAWVPRWAEVTTFHRGFLELIRCEAEVYLNRGDEVRLRTPLTGLRLDGPGHLAIPVFRGRALDGIRFLILSVSVPERAWPQFSTCAHLGRLEQLWLNSKGPAPALVTALVDSTDLGALRDLRLTWCGLGEEQSARLVRHPWVSRLRRLDLSNNHIADEGAAAILESPHLDGLELLNLRGNPLAEGRLADALRRRFGGRLQL
jgi:uncharacterized protein (TIGR02996 family)